MALLHAERLSGLHPDLIDVVQRIAGAASFDLLVSQGWRDNLTQMKYFLAGKTRARTADASPHGWGLGVDLAPMLPGRGGKWPVDNDPSWDELGDLAVTFGQLLYVERGKVAMGNWWGGEPSFVKQAGFRDAPHVQLPDWRSLKGWDGRASPPATPLDVPGVSAADIGKGVLPVVLLFGLGAFLLKLLVRS